MRSHFHAGVIGLLAVLAAGISAQQATAPKPPPSKPVAAVKGPAKPPASKPPAPRNGGMRYVASIRDIMHVLIDPNATRIFDAVSIESSAEGIREIRPQTDEEWDELAHSAIALAEAVNLLKMPNRPMAQKGEMNVDPEGPELAPAEILARMKRTPALWAKYADALQDAAVQALALIEKKDADGLFAFGGDLDTACENCHLEYWYPENKRAP